MKNTAPTWRPYQYLSFVLEDDVELERIDREYSAGRMMSGEVKQMLIDVMAEYTPDFQKRRAAITDGVHERASFRI
ncbi:unnamed protein product [Peronospora belbahrii]|uniref:Uncharacterized protein n=1 Tax=Peronospora belbahrii TaxID=622444 RepID=A0ABN8D7Y6_9STRA|nr:unnamed protein product [Peronospora belbahrii]